MPNEEASPFSTRTCGHVVYVFKYVCTNNYCVCACTLYVHASCMYSLYMCFMYVQYVHVLHVCTVCACASCMYCMCLCLMYELPLYVFCVYMHVFISKCAHLFNLYIVSHMYVSVYFLKICVEV